MTKQKKLPKGWRWETLDVMCDSIGGGTPSRKVEAYYKGEVPWLTVKDLHEGEYEVSDSSEHITPEAISKSGTNLIEPNCVILATRVGLGKAAVNSTPVAINQDLRAFRPKNGVDSTFLLFGILNSLFNILKFKQGTTVKGVTKNDLLSCEIPLPPLAVQERIVEVLQQADAIRRKRAEGFRILRKIATPLFEKFFGNLENSQWPTRKVGSVLREQPTNGKSPSKRIGLSTADVLTLTAVRGGRLNVEQKKTRKFDQPDLSNFYIKNKDAFIVRGNGNINLLGRMGFYSGHDIEAVYPDTMIRLRFDNSIVADEFMVYLWDTEIIRQQIRRKAKTTNGAHKISQADLVSLEFPCPPLDIQMKFPEVVDQYFESLGGNIAAEDSCASLLNSLLARAFTGELTAEWEAANAEWIAERQTFYERLPRLALLSLLLERHQRAGSEAVTFITALMKYAFLAQMEGELRRRLYRFVPYHYGPCAMELFNDLKALAAEGLITVENNAEEDKTRIMLTDPTRAVALLEEEARKDDARFAALEKAGEDTETAADPAMSRLLKRRAETLETLRADAATILNTYGNLGHSALLKAVYEKYPAYAKKSRIRKARKSNSGK
jgi:type I restriction enzyme S subunit